MNIFGVDVWTGFVTVLVTLFLGLPIKNGVLYVWKKVFGRPKVGA